MYFSGLSYRRTAEIISEHLEHPTDASTVYRWVRQQTGKAKGIVEDEKLNTGPEWVADEIQVKVGGERYWIFNVMDARTRVILSAHLSKERTARAAATALALARERAKRPPKRVKTDGLASYQDGLRRAFPLWEVRHIVSRGIRAQINNNLSERLQGTFRDRDKTLRGLKGQDTGQQYIDGLVLNYNYFRPHGGLNGRTPADAADAEIPVEGWRQVAEA